MGMRATLTLMSAKDYAKLVKNPKAEFSLEGEKFDIDKAWMDFDECFITMPGSLKYAIEGKYCPYGSLEDSEGMHSGFVSPAVASRIAEALSNLPFREIFDSVKERYKANDLKVPDDEKAYLKVHYATLKKAYAAAAKKKLAVYIDIC